MVLAWGGSWGGLVAEQATKILFILLLFFRELEHAAHDTTVATEGEAGEVSDPTLCVGTHLLAPSPGN